MAQKQLLFLGKITLRNLANFLFIALAFASCGPVDPNSDFARLNAYGSANELVHADDIPFRVFEHPSDYTLAVSVTDVLARGALTGLALNLKKALPPGKSYRSAAEIYLTRHDAFNGCKITSGRDWVDPFWEFSYEC